MAKPIISPVVPTVTSPVAGSSPMTSTPTVNLPQHTCLRRGEVAGLLQVSVWTVDRMAAAGEIRKVKFGRAARFVRTEVEEFLNKKNN